MQYDIEDHPDLRDAAWLRAANRRAKREIRGQRRQALLRRHSGKIVAAIALAVTGAVLFGLYRAGTFDGVSLPQVTLPQVTLPTTVAPYQGVNVEKPFAGTPAEQWADGEKGIVAPDQDPEYAASYEAVRKALITGHVDPRVIADHDMEPFVAPLAPAQQGPWRNEPGGTAITRLKKGTKLLPNGIKVDGRMWPGRDEYGRPVVHTSYRFAYAFDPGDKKTLLDQYEIVALQRADVDYQLTADGFWITKSDGFWYSMACKSLKEGFLAPMFVEKRPLPTGVTKDDFRKPEEWFAPDAKMSAANCE
ncbi:hypothetical protein [Lentzea nigeriaca]|uniref:hypothetical protein n=1 Tax=Lentzea nigeriaca TaxID=1128665 RepID=UPI00195E933A|nr:hypothetical protein [Lentzea nigeriaca]MBM7864806.1 hypothetical protein [Lentzea nigeriaca]